MTQSHSKGITLIETMVALTLGSIVTLGVTQLFVANAETYRLITGQSNVQESGRFALSTIARSAELSGHKGCFSKNDEMNRTFLADLPYEFNLEVGLLGYEGETSSWSPDIETVLPKTVGTTDTNVYTAGVAGVNAGIDTTTIIRGTDILTLNYISDRKYRVATSVIDAEVDVKNSDATNITALTDFDFGVDEIIFIHDCEKGTVFRVTGFTAGFEIEHSMAVDPDGYTNAVLKLPDFNSFDTDAYVSTIISMTYYIAPGEGRNNLGNIPLSLWRKSGISAPQEMLEGVEDLQIQYGVDTDNDNVPNRYVSANAVIDFDNVLTLRIRVVANSIDSGDSRSQPTHGCLGTGAGKQDCISGENYDGLIRRTFTQTIALRNRG